MTGREGHGPRFSRDLEPAQALVWASDYPHPDATFPGAVEKTVAAMESLSEGARSKILAINAARLYGIGPHA